MSLLAFSPAAHRTEGQASQLHHLIYLSGSGSYYSPISQVGKLRLREVPWLSQSHIARKKTHKTRFELWPPSDRGSILGTIGTVWDQGHTENLTHCPLNPLETKPGNWLIGRSRKVQLSATGSRVNVSACGSIVRSHLWLKMLGSCGGGRWQKTAPELSNSGG